MLSIYFGYMIVSAINLNMIFEMLHVVGKNIYNVHSYVTKSLMNFHNPSQLLNINQGNLITSGKIMKET